MSYQISKPSLIFSPYVKHYWTLNNCKYNGNEHVQRIVPSGLVELIFYLSKKPKTTDQKKSIDENTVITGQLTNYYDLKVSDSLSLFSILFQPQGLSVFFDVPVKEFFNQSVPLKYFLKDKVNELEEKLYDAISFSEKIVVAENFLLECLKKSKKKYQFGRIDDSIHTINQNKGITTICSLAERACLSRKQFERTFAEFVGISPGQFLKVVRFQNAIHERTKNKHVNLTTITYQCGYYDQSHMTGEFYKLTGMSPKQYFNECEPYSDYFQ